MCKKRAISILLAICLVTMLLPFSGTASASALADTDYRDIFTKANQKLLKAKSYHMTIETSMSASLQGKSISFVASGETAVQAKPILMKSTVTTTMEITGKKTQLTIVQYFEEAEDKLILYSNHNNQWSKMVIPNYNPHRSYEDLFKGITKVTLVRETDDTLVLDTTVNGSYLQNNIENAMATPGIQKAKLPDGLFKNLGDFKFTTVIDKKTQHITKMHIDMSDMMKTVGNNIAESLEMPEDKKLSFIEFFSGVKFVMNISFSRFNKADAVTIPKEARNAVLTPSSPPAQPDPLPPGKPTPGEVMGLTHI